MRVRNGDTTSAERARIRRGECEALVTTPESLALLLSHADGHERLAALGTVVVDEWHELLGDKRGALLALNLERLRRLAGERGRTAPLAVLGLSATLGNLETALAALLGPGRPGRIVAGRTTKAIAVDSLLPTSVARFPWAGHLGLAQLPAVAAAVASARSTLVFTNTRAQAELWHEALSSVWTDQPGRLALHHGSLDRAARDAVEAGLREGRIRCVVATSSLDLGVDFPSVDQVIQIGSPKGIARLVQRAGRSGHRPGETSRVLCVPTHALELLDLAAARRALARGLLEAREPPVACLDVLAQHVATSALAGPVRADDLRAEARATLAFAHLSEVDWRRVLNLVTRGGDALAAYPDFQRVVEADGWLAIASPRIARLQRQSIGTIVADGQVAVKYRNGATLGHLEESFIARLKAGDRFLFAGRSLELVRTRELVAYVRPAAARHAVVPRWMGGRMPLSSNLAAGVRALLADPVAGDEPELALARPCSSGSGATPTCRAPTNCSSSASVPATASTCSCTRSPGAARMRGWPPWSRPVSPRACPAVTAGRRPISVSWSARACCRHSTLPGSRRCSRMSTSTATLPPASISANSRAAASARSPGSRASSRRDRPAERSRCANSRHRPA